MKEERYTKETWAVYTAALNNANNILRDATASTAAIEQAYNELNNALNGLVEKWGYHDCFGKT